MIIKSMSRKEGSFSQLYKYMEKGANRDDDKYRFIYNCFGRKKEQVLNEFQNNSEQLKQRKNGVYLYHEIISISRSKNLSNEAQKKALYEIVQEYTKRRAFGNLACGYMHDEKDNNLHFHLMISSNEVGKSNRTSLRKKEFSTLKVEMEKWVLMKYPELEQAKIISKKNHYKDNKEEFTDSLQSILSTAKSREDFHKLLENNQASYKVRGKTITFTNTKTGKKHRLNTLGLAGEYALMESRFNGEEVMFDKVKEVVKTAGKIFSGNGKSEEKKQPGNNQKEDKKTENESVNETVRETINEWVFGDFTARDQRAKDEKSKENLEAWKKKKAAETNEFVADREDQTRTQNIKETAKEWIQGDFSNRENRTAKQEAKERLERFRVDKAKSKQKKNEKSKGKGGKTM